MAYRQRTYPYPVLSPYTDDFFGDLELQMEIMPADDDSVLKLIVAISLPTAWEEYLLDQPDAVEFLVDVYGSETLSRRLFSFSDGTFRQEIALSVSDFAGPVVLTPIAVARKASDDYNPNGFHSDFKDLAPFSVLRGDLLGFGLTQKVHIVSHDELLRKSVFEFDVVRSEELPSFAYQVSVTASSLKVYCGEEFLAFFRRFENDPMKAPFLFLGFYVECLRSALEAGNRGDDLSEELMNESIWFQKLSNLVANLPDEVQNMSEHVIAQALVAKRGISKIAQFAEDGDKDD